MTPLETTVLVIGGVAVVAWFVKLASGDDRSATDGEDRDVEETVGNRGGGEASRRLAIGGDAHDADADERDEDELDDDEPSQQIVPMTSDGGALLADGDSVLVLAPRAVDATGEMVSPEALLADPRTRAVVDRLTPGDLIAARLVRGSPDHDPWRVEALGRDEEYRAWRFETEDAARAALLLFQRRIVRPMLDRDGEPLVPDADAFTAARLAEEATERELDLADDEAEEPEDRPR